MTRAAPVGDHIGDNIECNLVLRRESFFQKLNEVHNHQQTLIERVTTGAGVNRRRSRTARRARDKNN